MKKLSLLAGSAMWLILLSSCDGAKVRVCKRAYDAITIMADDTTDTDVNGYRSKEQAERTFRACYAHMNASERREAKNRSMSQRDCDAIGCSRKFQSYAAAYKFYFGRRV